MDTLNKLTSFCGSGSWVFSAFLVSCLCSCQWLPSQEKDSLTSGGSTDNCQSSIEDLNQDCIIQIGTSLSDSELIKFVLNIKKRNPRALWALAHRAEQTLPRDLVVAKVGSSLGGDYTLAMSRAFLLFKKLIDSPEKWEKLELNDTDSEIFSVGKGLMAYQSKSKEIVLVNTKKLERIKTYKFDGTDIQDFIKLGENEFLTLEDNKKVSRWSSKAESVVTRPIQTYNLEKKGHRGTLREISPTHFAVEAYDVSWETLSLFNVETGARQDIDIKGKYYELTKIGDRDVVILGPKNVYEGDLTKVDVENGTSSSFKLGVQAPFIVGIFDIGNGLLEVSSSKKCVTHALVVNVMGAPKVVGEGGRMKSIRGTDFVISEHGNSYTLFTNNPWQQKQTFKLQKGKIINTQAFLGSYFALSNQGPGVQIRSFEKPDELVANIDLKNIFTFVTTGVGDLAISEWRERQTVYSLYLTILKHL